MVRADLTGLAKYLKRDFKYSMGLGTRRSLCELALSDYMNAIINWSCIPGYEDRYIISDRGEVRHFPDNTSKGRPIKPRQNNCGYLMVDLYKSGKRQCLLLHRLVAITFLPNPNKYEVVNHIDRDKTNCDVSNLEWCSQSYNILHSYTNPNHGNKRKSLTQ